MKIALAQHNYIVGDIEGNTSKIITSINRAKAEGADLVIFAEQAISGLNCFDLLRKSTFVELCEDALVQIASYCDGIAAIVGLPLLTSKGTVSAAALIQDRQVLRFVGKRHVHARREMGFLVAGRGYECATIAGHKVAIAVGADVRHIKDLDPSVETIISINARKYGKGILTYRFEVLREMAFVGHKNVVIINQVGGNSDIVYDGSSGIFNKRGELALYLKSFEEDYGMLDLAEDKKGLQLAPFTSYNDRTRMLFKAAVSGVQDYFEKNNYTKACVGLSGGIDSSVVATLAVKALGAENVMGLMMPSKFSSEASLRDAEKLAQNLGVEYKIIPITDAYETMIASLESIVGGTEFDVTEENIQSRLRMIMLMALQNKRGYTLLNTSNKSESALGLCTLYGDTAGAFSPVGDLYQSEIYDLARFINKSSSELIPEEIIHKDPESELNPNGKSSEVDLPPYEVVDAILTRMIEMEQHREEIINAGFDFDAVEKIHSMIMGSEKKRFQYPPVLRLSTYSFGHERLMPLINKYGD
ncbi:MAG: NAD+ synthase [Rikenellaceae bacterium]